ncbi:hypothetical protein F5X68DRAFT_42768 [Plectosphaerella plurivora]|uniref:Uncharacterized protein n=1 Tax=Plectosphaerella plurivora TaxID=936078 RepID=A0A9P8V3Q1_9PEZI|nr:hypothetical protein F5X68DRAFT_42768 [Plectosphaerella plurivora]
MASSFTDEEKRFILSEMIKQSKVDVETLVDFVESNGIEADWHAMQLPVGKTLNQCFGAADSMFNTTVPRPSLKRKALGSPPEQPPKRRPPTADLPPARYIPFAEPPPLQTSFRTSPPFYTPPPVAHGPMHGTQLVSIQPRPPHMERMSSAPAAPPEPAVPRATGSRRRGRPSRADQSRLLRPVLPQLVPIAPRTPVVEDPPRIGSPLTVSTPLAGSPAPQEIPNPPKRRGRPPAADKSKPKNDAGGPLQPLVSTPPIGHHDLPPGPPTEQAVVPSRPPDTPETTSSSISRSPAKEHAIATINPLKQEALVR